MVVVKFDTCYFGRAGLAVNYYSMLDFENTECEKYYPNMDDKKVNELYKRWKNAVEATLKF